MKNNTYKAIILSLFAAVLVALPARAEKISHFEYKPCTEMFCFNIFAFMDGTVEVHKPSKTYDITFDKKRKNRKIYALKDKTASFPDNLYCFSRINLRKQNKIYEYVCAF